jgi:ribonuclease E
MTRKRIGTGLLEAFSTECPHCHGRGVELHDMPVESQRQADGGTRDSGGRDSRRGERNTGSNRRRSEPTPKVEAAGEPADEPVSVS